MKGSAFRVDGVPHTHHDEAGSSDAHGPAHALDGDFSSVVLV